jgi:hypothetical protein
MTAAGLLESIQQRLLVGLEEDHRRLQARVGQLPQHLLQLLEVVAPANIGDHRSAAHAASLVAKELAERADHSRRQVVDAEVTAVLEGRDRLGLARTRVPGDHDEVDGRPPVTAADPRLVNG